jgi:hypothetical protein
LKTEGISVFNMSTNNSIFSGVISKITVKEFSQTNIIRIVFWKLNLVELYNALNFIELFTLIFVLGRLIS